MKIEEGGGMDIQKKEEAFGKWFATRYPNIQKTIDLNSDHESIVFRNNQSEAWQEAKAQAVPELTDKMIVAIESEVENQLKASSIDADPFRLDGEKIWYAAIESQEPAK